jgi:hypothetical protein
MPTRVPPHIMRTLTDAAALLSEAKKLLEASAEAVRRSRMVVSRDMQFEPIRGY